MQPIGHEFLANVLDLLRDAICVVDPQGRFVFVSAASERIFGYTPQEMIGTKMIDLVHPDDRARTLGAVDEIVAGDPKPNFENRYVRKDGRIVHIMWSAHWSEALQVRVAVARDVTGRKRAEAVQAALYAISEAAHTAEDLPALFQHIDRIVGELLPAGSFSLALHDATADPLGALRVDERFSEADIELLKFVSAQVANAIDRKQAQIRLQHVAAHDPLTDLPNRSLVADRLSAALARARRDKLPLSLLYLDLDGFKRVNDSLGHAMGDRLLQEVAQRLRRCVRESDTVGRMGGDEFVVLLVGMQSCDPAANVAEKIRLALCEPFELGGQPLSVTPSIGIVHSPEHGIDGEQLIRRADEAMYRAKHAGGNRAAMG